MSHKSNLPDKPLHRFFENDHRQIDQFLNKALEQSQEIDLDYYHLFRTRLLRHIKMEEKILFPAAKSVDPETVDKLIPQYRLEHGAITALMVPPPNLSLLKVIRFVLEKHNAAEEEPGGLYDICEDLTKKHVQELLHELKTIKEVPVRPFNSAPIAIEAAKRALIRAGYDFDEILEVPD